MENKVRSHQKISENLLDHEQKRNFSSSYSLNTRKYFLGPIFIAVSILLFLKGGVWSKIIGCILFAIGLFYVLLKKVEFDDDYVYVGNKKYTFKQLTKLGFIEVNLYIFPYIEIQENGKKRRIITDSGQAGFLPILIGIMIPSIDPLRNIKSFKQLLDASRKDRNVGEE